MLDIIAAKNGNNYEFFIYGVNDCEFLIEENVFGVSMAFGFTESLLGT